MQRTMAAIHYATRNRPSLLQLDVADNEASMRFVHLINVALGTRTTLLNDAAHMLRHA